MDSSTWMTGLYAAALQAAAVVILVYVVVALIGARSPQRPRTHRS
jgi:hypothetical protein